MVGFICPGLYFQVTPYSWLFFLRGFCFRTRRNAHITVHINIIRDRPKKKKNISLGILRGEDVENTAFEMPSMSDAGTKVTFEILGDKRVRVVDDSAVRSIVVENGSKSVLHVIVGKSVGFIVGFTVGFVVGLAVGFTVGIIEGFVVGSIVGFVVGFIVGLAVGSIVGSRVGSVVGSRVGSAVGSAVGSHVGSVDGSKVG